MGWLRTVNDFRGVLKRAGRAVSVEFWGFGGYCGGNAKDNA